MAQQTAIEWLINEWPVLESNIPPRIIEQAKAIEEERKEQAYREGANDQRNNTLRYKYFKNKGS